MRTTLDIDDEVLEAAKEIARRERKSAGQVISELARRALTEPRATAAPEMGVREPASFYGFRPIPPRAAVVTNDLVDRLRDEEGI